MNYQKLKVAGEKESAAQLRILRPKSAPAVGPKFSFQEHQRLIIAQESSIRIIPFEEIRYLKSDSNYTTVHLIDGSSIYVSRTMKSIGDQLDHTFLRVHNSFIVNLKQIREYSKGENVIVLDDESLIPVSRSRKADILNLL